MEVWITCEFPGLRCRLMLVLSGSPRITWFLCSPLNKTCLGNCWVALQALFKIMWNGSLSSEPCEKMEIEHWKNFLPNTIVVGDIQNLEGLEHIFVIYECHIHSIEPKLHIHIYIRKTAPSFAFSFVIPFGFKPIFIFETNFQAFGFGFRKGLLFQICLLIWERLLSLWLWLYKGLYI